MRHTASLCTHCQFVLLLLSFAAVGFATSPSERPTTAFAADRLALLSFKSLIHEDPSRALASWINKSLHFCRWRGVTCSNYSHQLRVTALDLESLGLAGSISPSLANLTFLQRLHLPENQLKGPIPQELGRLSHLQHLNLSSNPLGGMIPMSLLQNCSHLHNLSLFSSNIHGLIPRNLSRCSELQLIELEDNMLEGEIPGELGSLSKLKDLLLSKNSITGSIPSEIGNPAHLTRMYLDENQLTGTIPSSIGNLTVLTRLVLEQNNLTGVIPPSIWNLSSLILLNLRFNHLVGSLPRDIGNNLPHLQKFFASDNHLYGPLPDSWSGASNLEIIQMDDNNFTGIVPSSLGSLRRLNTLTFQSNLLEARNAADWSFLDALANCTKLKWLILADNKLGGVLPRSIANLSTTLEMIAIQNNQIAGSIPEQIGNLVGLTRLWMDSNLLSGTIPSVLGSLPGLGIIELWGNFFTGGIPTTLGNLTSLIILDLSFNELQGSIPPSLGNCPLELLELDSNKLNGTLPKEILSIPTFTMYLNVSNNSLTGSLPLEVGKLKNIQALYISNNRFSGEIPSSIGECQMLQNLYMQRNLFKGSIPSSLAQLKGLGELDLSRNNLSGHIPDFLGNFLNMTYLNLSYNHLDGEVPIDGVFRNASAFSVLGNKDLCGGIPEANLPPCYNQTSGKKHLSVKIIVIILVTGGLLCFIFLISFFVARYWLQKSRRKSSTTPWFRDQQRKVSFAELLRATNGFSPANLIGMGSFGSVYKGTMNWEEHQDVAVKVLNLHQEGASRSFMAECEALRNIKHRNLVKILTSCSSVDFQGNDFKALVFEFLPNGSLDNWLHPEVNEYGTSRRLTLIHRLNISIDVAFALDYLHHHSPTSIVHCDLKPSNILLDHDMVAHVGDFGLARFLKKAESKSSPRSTNSITLKGSIGYAAPEYGMANKVSAQGDVYSHGILLLEMFTGKRPTDNIFKEGLSLHKYVEMALSEQVTDIIDPQLLLEEEEGDASPNSMTNEISRRQALEIINLALRIGILCSKESPSERMHMTEVIRELQKIRDAFLKGIPK